MINEEQIQGCLEAGDGLSAAWYPMQDIHRIFGTPAPCIPIAQTIGQVERRAKWINEEVEELLEAGDDLIGQADAYLDIIVFALGGLVEQGVNPGPLLDIVLRSQYGKIWEDGLPRVRESDGKWIKPEGWVAPEPALKEAIERQINEN